MSRIVDLSHRLAPGMPSYPGMLEPQFRTWFTHEESASRGTYSPGTTFQIATYELGSNTGTYVDAPFHRHPGAPDLAGLPLEKLADLPGVVGEGAEEGEVPWQAFEGVDLRGKAVLVRTGWSRRWGEPGYFRSGPYLGEEVCRKLVEAGATLVGIDCANIDNMSDPARPAHTILLAAGIPIVEHLRDLDQLPQNGFRFFAVPPAIEQGTSFTVRAFAIVES
ncbi:MAG TPA: cyclase family protein [Chloroflexia bacterium]|nr:cyclase family protein [Chloroflexia bacterium]